MIDWLRELNGLSPNCKLRTYRIFKTDFCLEPHLLCIQNKKHQRAMTRLRVSSHKLQIEAGRYSLPTVPTGDRLCTYCEKNVIDDENHFMMACNFHDAERESLFVIISPYLDIRDHNDIMGKFKAIMESRDPQVIKPLSRYVFKSFCKRGHRWVSWIWSNAPGQRVTYFLSIYLLVGYTPARSFVLRQILKYRHFNVVF